MQLWLRDCSQAWVPVDALHPHPYMPDYVLYILHNHEPRWVTKDTVRTYRGREKKRAFAVTAICESVPLEVIHRGSHSVLIKEGK